MATDLPRSRRWHSDELRWSSLMRNAHGGDGRAYEQLLTELCGVIEAYLRSRFGALEALEDCVQECLLALHRARHTYNPARPFRPWMFAIVKHRCIDVLRRAPSARTGHDPDLLQAPGSDVSSQLDSALLLRRLAPREREAVQLAKLAGYSMAEAGQHCGVSEGAMKVRVHRAMRALRKLLGREGLPT